MIEPEARHGNNQSSTTGDPQRGVMECFNSPQIFISTHIYRESTIGSKS